MTEDPVAVWEGVFNVVGVEVHCYVLDDGRRLIDAADLEAMFSSVADAREPLGAFHDMMRWAKGLDS